MPVDELKILTPTGMLGYGIPEEHLRAGMGRGLDAIIVDSASVDPGLSQLGLGWTLVPERALLREFRQNALSPPGRRGTSDIRGTTDPTPETRGRHRCPLG